MEENVAKLMNNRTMGKNCVRFIFVDDEQLQLKNNAIRVDVNLVC